MDGSRINGRVIWMVYSKIVQKYKPVSCLQYVANRHPSTATQNVLAPLVECAEKASVSLPAKHKVSFIQ